MMNDECGMMNVKAQPAFHSSFRIHRSSSLRVCLLFALFFSFHASALARGARRVVVIKVDGLPFDMLDRFVRERDPRTGKSLLPWFEHVFYEGGTRLSNFYVRGMSLSAPSWSLLDTGQHLQIKGNVEFDRYTLHSYDYLNVIPFWLNNAVGARVDMPEVEVLDDLGVPLVSDSYSYEERYQSFQLLQRGARWTTLERGLGNRFASRGPEELFDEWQTGIGGRGIIDEQQERELIEKLAVPSMRYFDLYLTAFDHASHHNRDDATHLAVLKELDALVGLVWTAVQKTPQAADTALVVVSDHGTNSDPRFYSQGFNLVKLLGSRDGGGHHVVTKRRLLADYAIKGIYPLVPLIYTTTDDSYYLKGQSTSYPTALVDFDGNERSAVQLRDGDLNLIHILLQQLKRTDLSEPLRRAGADALFSTIERRRAEWQRNCDTLGEETAALRRLAETQRAVVGRLPKKFTKADMDAGRDKVARRETARLTSLLDDERDYTAYRETLVNLLALDRARFNPAAVNIEDLIAKRAMGEHNTIYELQNYVVGLAPGGLTLAPDGSLDTERSFARVNYFSLLGGVTVRNNVQPGVESRPVDFVAARLPIESLRGALKSDEDADEAVWLYAAPDSQALVLSRLDEGRLLLRYLPVANLRQDARGRVTFDRADFRAGLPLKVWEDERLALPQGASRGRWLAGWHTDLEWLRAAHRTRYSNGVVGLEEQFGRHTVEGTEADAPGLSADERLLRRFRQRQRQLVEGDLLVFANDHWNFDVRGFNSGGNHGSFLRVSTHATLLFAGGERTGIPRGLNVSEPYDSLSFAPTLFALTGQLEDGTKPVQALWQRGFRTFPGRIISELFNAPPPEAPLADTTTKPEDKR
jgi:hypothetical protein